MKYRVWDSFKEKFVTDVFLMPGDDSEKILVHKIELYTGLKDKNGKEIYEGDIVRHNFYSEMRRGEVRREEASFGVFFLPRDFWSIGALEAVEVVGNIHENPELLKGES